MQKFLHLVELSLFLLRRRSASKSSLFNYKAKCLLRQEYIRESTSLLAIYKTYFLLLTALAALVSLAFAIGAHWRSKSAHAAA